MSPIKLKDAAVGMALALTLVLGVGSAHADAHERIRIPVGRSEVVVSSDDVRTVAIAEPKIADAAVGSQRTVVVSGKTLGITTLVVYGEGGRYSTYDIDVYQPNSDKQIKLHVRVAEVTEDAKRQLGWDFYGNGVHDGVSLNGALVTGKVTPLPVPPLAIGPVTDGNLGFTNKFGDFNFQMAWKALEEKGKVRLLANPTVVASSGDTASFVVGGEIPIPVASASGTGGTTITIVWKQYGIKVDMRPTLLEDGNLELRVQPEVSALDFNNAIKLSDTIVPALVTRKAMTLVELKPGENFVIGGLKQTDRIKNVRKVPILGDIPLLGFFLSSSETQKTDRELMIVVSPEIDNASSAMPKLPTDGVSK